jgi:hypothetical protein
MNIITLKRAVWAGLFLGAVFNAAAVQVTFGVDMTQQIAVGYFNPGNGDTVEVRGDFNNWNGGATLTNSLGNPNVYTGTFDDANTVGSPQGYKFVKVIGGGYYWENDLTPATGNNRTFSLSASAQVLPVVYFNDFPPPTGVPTNNVTFQVDMTVQLTNGNFNPGNGDTVVARGTFMQTPNQWDTGLVLTNSPGNTNLYSGTYPDGNYPGTQEALKFVIVSGFDNWESVPNRPFTLQGGGQTLPTVFFNNQPGTLVPVTFQVDLTQPVQAGTFVPGTDTVEVRGTFQQPAQWAGGLGLTNDPAAANTNLYSGTFSDANAPGTVEQYKFVVDGGGGPLGWEKPATTAGDNRPFTLAANAQTLAAVYFGDVGPGDALTADTLVTFSVNMTNAVGTDSVHFDPLVNNVFLNGDFVGWWGWGPPGPAPYQMSRVGGSLVYTLTELVPAGHSLALTYKYSIDGADDESGFKSNHVSYIRATGNYSLPLDVFGAQAVEPAVGSLAIAPSVTPGHVTLSWNGRPGVHLQSSTNLAGSFWLDVANTDGLSSTNLPAGAVRTFYRLIKP